MSISQRAQLLNLKFAQTRVAGWARGDVDTEFLHKISVFLPELRGTGGYGRGAGGGIRLQRSLHSWN